MFTLQFKAKDANKQDITIKIPARVIKHEEKSYFKIQIEPHGTFLIPRHQQLGEGAYSKVFLAYPYNELTEQMDPYPRVIKFQLPALELDKDTETKINNSKYTHRDEETVCGKIKANDGLIIDFILMPYIPGEPLEKYDRDKKQYVIHPDLKKLNFRQRAELSLQIESDFHRIHSLTKDGSAVIYHDVQTGNLNIYVKDPLYYFPVRKRNLFTVKTTPEFIVKTPPGSKDNDEIDSVLSEEIEKNPISPHTGYSQTEFDHNLAKWLRLNKAGTILFAFTPPAALTEKGKWHAYFIISEEPKKYDSKEIPAGSPFLTHLKEINPTNALSYDTTKLRNCLKQHGKILFNSYEYDEKIDYQTGARVLDFGLSEETELDPDQRKDMDAVVGSPLFLKSPENLKGINDDLNVVYDLYIFNDNGADPHNITKERKEKTDHIKNPYERYIAMQ